MTNITWQKVTSLPPGLTVSGMALAKRSSETGASVIWVSSPAGLFCENDGQFVYQLHGIPFQNATAVHAVGKTIFAAGHPNHIVYSSNGGGAWFSSRVDPIASAVSCFATSPNFSQDATLLAGSYGEGVLRSTDSGQSWQLSNFGLGSLNILALACSPEWNLQIASNSVPYRYEIVFAATEEGLYMSPNAGRAWQSAGEGLPSHAVLSLAVSPDFKRVPVLSGALHSDEPSRFQGYVFAGTDGAGLYRSRDGGLSWQALASAPAEMTVNTLAFSPQGTLYAGSSEHGLLASADMGETWDSLWETEDAVLCLAVNSSKLLAGTAENGLWASDGRLVGNSPVGETK